MKKCFAYNNAKCKALKILPSQKHCEKCKFYKTQGQYDSDVSLAERLLKLKRLKPYKYTDKDGTSRMYVERMI